MTSERPTERLGVSHLRCEYLVAPLGIDERLPRLSWMLESSRRGARQTAYHLRVASTPAILAAGGADRWDSGRVAGNQTTHVVYDGTPLRSRGRCHWCVEVWDDEGHAVMSAPSLWTMGLLEGSDWSARWIAANPAIIARDPDAVAPTLAVPGTPGLFRKDFLLPEAVSRATLYASARGLVELRANGARVGNDVFAPEWTDYDTRIQYRTYDVTSLMQPGRNTLGATLGDGWWSGYVGWQETRGRYGSIENSLIVQLEIELIDGRRVVVCSDGSWACHTGPILSSDFMMGEVYDARRERDGWDTPSYSSVDWLPAREVAAPGVPLVAQRSESVRVTEWVRPVSVTESAPGRFLFDLGQNIAGWARLLLDAPAGTRVTLRHGERLNPDGTLYTANLRRARATDVYTCRGGRAEVFEPHFTFHGFQYVELTGLPYAPGVDAVTGCVVRSAMPDAGTFRCSNPGVNRLAQNALWSQKGNFLSVPTDCPQRDERLGWMGDAEVFIRTATYQMDVAAFFTKWMQDIEDAQTPEGVFPDTAPRLPEGDNFVGLGNLAGAAGWADAGVAVPYTLWQVYGDRRILERHYQAMVAWVDWIDRHNPTGLRVNDLGNNYGDWLCIPSDTSFGTHSPMKYLVATAFWADDCAKLSRIARALGRVDDERRFGEQFEHVRGAFQREWLQPDGRITTDTQTGYLLALAFDLLPDVLRPLSAAHLVANIRALDWHLSTGFIGIRHLNPELTLAGYGDVAYRLLLRDDYPSWLYPVRHGATTIWERWNGWTHQDGFCTPEMNSFNHYSLGSVAEWLYRHVLGIELDADAPGFQRFILRPFIGDGLDSAGGTYRTMHGVIESAWTREGRTLVWRVHIPANTSATVYVPARAGADVTESGIPIDLAPGIRFTRRDARALVCDVGAGHYTFVSTM